MNWLSHALSLKPTREYWQSSDFLEAYLAPTQLNKVSSSLVKENISQHAYVEMLVN